MKKKFLIILMCITIISLTACSSKDSETFHESTTAVPLTESIKITPIEKITETTTEIITPIEEITEIPTKEPAIKPTKEITSEITNKITEEPTPEITDEITSEPTEEVTPEPTENITFEPTAEPVEIQTYSYNGLEFEFPAKNNKYFEKLLAVDLTNHDYDGTYIGFYDDGAKAIVYMNNSNDEIYYDFGDFEEDNDLEKKDPKKWAEYSDDWYQEYLLFINGERMAVDLNNDEYISDIELYICIDFSLGMKKSMKGLSTY